MQWVTLPLYEDWNYISTVVLEDGSYTVQMTYSERDNSWTMNLSQEQGEDVIVGRKISIRDAVYVNDKYLTGVFWLEPKYLNANETKLHPSLISKYFNFYYGWGDVAEIVKEAIIFNNVTEDPEPVDPVGSIGLFTGVYSGEYGYFDYNGNPYVTSKINRIDNLPILINGTESFAIWCKPLDGSTLEDWWTLEAVVDVKYGEGRSPQQSLRPMRDRQMITFSLDLGSNIDWFEVTVTYKGEAVSQKVIYKPIHFEIDGNLVVSNHVTYGDTGVIPSSSRFAGFKRPWLARSTPKEFEGYERISIDYKTNMFNRIGTLYGENGSVFEYKNTMNRVFGNSTIRPDTPYDYDPSNPETTYDIGIVEQDSDWELVDIRYDRPFPFYKTLNVSPNGDGVYQVFSDYDKGAVPEIPIVSKPISENGSVTNRKPKFPERLESGVDGNFKGVMVSSAYQIEFLTNVESISKRVTGWKNSLTYHKPQTQNSLQAYVSHVLDGKRYLEFFVVYDSDDGYENVTRTWNVSAMRGNPYYQIIPHRLCRDWFGDAYPVNGVGYSLRVIVSFENDTNTYPDSTNAISMTSSDGVELFFSFGHYNSESMGDVEYVSPPPYISAPERPEPFPETRSTMPTKPLCGIIQSGNINEFSVLPSWRNIPLGDNDHITFGDEGIIQMRPVSSENGVNSFVIGLYDLNSSRSENLNREYNVRPLIKTFVYSDNDENPLGVFLTMESIQRPDYTFNYDTSIKWYRVTFDMSISSATPCVSGQELIFYSDDGLEFVMKWNGDPLNGPFGEPSKDGVFSDWKNLPPPPPTEDGEGVAKPSTFMTYGESDWLIEDPDHTSEDGYYFYYNGANYTCLPAAGSQIGLLLNGNPSLTPSENLARTWVLKVNGEVMSSAQVVMDAASLDEASFVMQFGATYDELCSVAGTQIVAAPFTPESGNTYRIEGSDGSYFQVVVS